MIDASLKTWGGERLVMRPDLETGAWVLIAIHSTVLGPATGGTRMKPYPDLDAAVTDALRLSAGMTMKFAAPGLPLVLALRELLAEFGETEELHSANTRALWREIRDVSYFAAGDDQVWRLSVPPSNGPDVARRIADQVGGRVFFDWGGGLIWLAMKAAPDAAHQTIRAAIGAGGGHATLFRASAQVRADVPVFQPQSGPLAGLTGRVKDSFDPKGVLNPGLMYEES